MVAMCTGFIGPQRTASRAANTSSIPSPAMSEPSIPHYPADTTARKTELQVEKLQLEIAALKKDPPGFWARLLDQWQGTVITIILGAFAAFPNFIADKVKGSFDRVEQRSTQFDRLSGDLSAYVFAAEHVAEFYGGDATVATTPEDLAKEYSNAIGTLRRHEHAYRAMIARLWGAEANQRYTSVVAEVKEVDALVHQLNAELRPAPAAPPTPAVDAERAALIAKLGPAVKKLSADLPDFLGSLE
jgi:hypothetical protein